MKTRARVTLLVSVVSCCTLLVGFWLGRSVNYSTAAKKQENAERIPEKTHTSLARKTNRTDLGGGISIKEVVYESKTGEARRRFTSITYNGERMVEKMWMAAGEMNKPKPTEITGYCHKGKMLANEGDDGNGASMLFLFNDEGLVMQAFEVKKNAVLLALSGERIRKMRENAKRTTEIMEPLIRGESEKSVK